MENSFEDIINSYSSLIWSKLNWIYQNENNQNFISILMKKKKSAMTVLATAQAGISRYFWAVATAAL